MIDSEILFSNQKLDFKTLNLTCATYAEMYLFFNIIKTQKEKLESFTMSKTDRHLLRQQVRQIISVIITNTCVFAVFKTKRELKCQN